MGVLESCAFCKWGTCRAVQWCVCVCVQHSFRVDWWVTGCVWLVRIADMPSPSPPTFPATLTSSVYPSLPPLALIMASGPGEGTTEVNAPPRRGAIVNEEDVKMSGWNRQIKEMRDEADVRWECLKRDWHMRERRERTWELQFDSAKIFFLVTSLSFLLWHFTLDYSLFWWLLTIAAHAKLLPALSFECMNTEKTIGLSEIWDVMKWFICVSAHM